MAARSDNRPRPDGPRESRELMMNSKRILQAGVGRVGSGGAEQFDDLYRIGAMLGDDVVKTWAEIRTHNRHGPR